MFKGGLFGNKNKDEPKQQPVQNPPPVKVVTNQQPVSQPSQPTPANIITTQQPVSHATLNEQRKLAMQQAFPKQAFAPVVNQPPQARSTISNQQRPTGTRLDDFTPIQNSIKAPTLPSQNFSAVAPPRNSNTLDEDTAHAFDDMAARQRKRQIQNRNTQAHKRRNDDDIMQLKKQTFSDSSDDNVALTFDVTESPVQPQVLSTTHIIGSKLDLTERNYMDEEFEYPEPKQILKVSPDPDYLKSFEATATEKKDFTPFYRQDSDEETKDIVAPLFQKDDSRRFEKRQTLTIQRERARPKPDEFKNDLLQKNNDEADLLGAEDDTINIFDDILESTLEKTRSNTQFQRQAKETTSNINPRDSKVILTNPLNPNLDFSDDEKADTVSIQSRTSDYRRGAVIKRGQTKPESEDDKLRKLREMRQKKEKEEAELNTSEDFIEDKSFDFDDSISGPDQKANGQDLTQSQDSKIDQFFKEVKEQNLSDLHDMHRSVEIIEDCVDALQIVDTNEKKYLDFAQNKQQEQKKAQANQQATLKTHPVVQRILTRPGQIRGITKSKDIIETCIALSSASILIGTKAGHLYVYDMETEKQIFIYKDDGFNCAITCIDVHPKRPELVVLGYERGQMSVLNLNTRKTIKQIKDVHKNNAVVTVRFVDWIKERPKAEDQIKAGQTVDLTVYEENAFMFVSLGSDGKLVINDVTVVGYSMMKTTYASDRTLVNPLNWDKQKCEVLASKFYDVRFPQANQKDLLNTLIAVGSTDEVTIFQIVKDGKENKTNNQLLTIERPNRYPSENYAESGDNMAKLYEKLPVLSWGYGRTPVFKDKSYLLLAIGWGPLVQLLVVIQDLQEVELTLDGFYFIAPGSTMLQKNEFGIQPDNMIESINFIDESLLLVTTTNSEVRVLLTQRLQYSTFQEPGQFDEIYFDKLSSLQYSTAFGRPWTDEQMAVELELDTKLENFPLNSMFGTQLSQTVSVYNENIVFLTPKDAIKAKHLSWQDCLGTSDSSILQESFFDVLEKALRIYLGQIRGLRGVTGDEKTRQEGMKTKLKEKIQVEANRFERRIDSKSGLLDSEIKKKFSAMIRRCIEFCVEIGEPDFLFQNLFQSFQDKKQAETFSEELKPYILMSHFSEYLIPEDILKENIMKYHQGQFSQSVSQFNTSPSSGAKEASSPTENFETMLINLRFDGCSKEYKLELIDDCVQLHLTSGLVHICLNAFGGEAGAVMSVQRLKDFYLIVKAEEEKSGSKHISLKDLDKLKDMPMSFPERLPLEKSSTYIGVKLMWIIRQFLIGQKFPKGLFTTNEWKSICHDLLDLITEEDFIKIMLDIEPTTYFMILTIVFNTSCQQHTFLNEVRQQRPPSDLLVSRQTQMSHDLIVKRLTSYCFDLTKDNPVRMHYLCFISSICDSYTNESQDSQFFCSVVLDLLKNEKQMLNFNKHRLLFQMDNSQMLRQLSRNGIRASDNLKHVVFSENNLMKLLKYANSLKPISEKMFEQLVPAVERTQFQNLKLMVYDLNQDYLKCLKLLLQKKEQSDDNEHDEHSVLSGKLQDGYAWIIEKHEFLRNRLKDPNEDTREAYQFKIFGKEVFNQAETLVKLDAHKAVGMCEVILEKKHLDMIRRLQNVSLQYQYIQTLIEVKKDDIKNQMNGYSQTNKNSVEATQWGQILQMHVRLICQLEPTKVVAQIKAIKKLLFYPHEDMLKICREFNQLEACAILSNKIGIYMDSVQIYLKLLKTNLDIRRFRKELYYLDELVKKIELRIAREKVEKLMNNPYASQIQTKSESTMEDLSMNMQKALWIKKHGKNIAIFNYYMSCITKLCMKHPDEVLKRNDSIWQMILGALFELIQGETMRKKRFCKIFFKEKMVEFCRVLLAHVKLDKLLAAMLRARPKARFKAVKDLIGDIFLLNKNEASFCEKVNGIISKDLLAQCEENLHCQESGFTFINLNELAPNKCDYCQINLIAGQSKKIEEIEIFDCQKNPEIFQNHAFHVRCLKKLYQEEIGKDNKKASQKSCDNVEFRKQLRCPVCEPVSFNILVEPVKPLAKPRSNKLSDDSSSKSSKSANSVKSQQEPSRKVSTTQSKTLEFSKRMKIFDAWQNESTLEAEDFFFK